MLARTVIMENEEGVCEWRVVRKVRLCVWSLVHRLPLSASRGEYSGRAAVFHINYQTTMASNPQGGLRSVLPTNDNVGIFNRIVTKQTDLDIKTAQPMRQCSMPDTKQNFQHSTHTYIHTHARTYPNALFSLLSTTLPPTGILSKTDKNVS
jgi:hypothetical protein